MANTQTPQQQKRGFSSIGLCTRSILAGILAAVILIAQLFLVTDALYELLSGHSGPLIWLALVSFIGFAIALLVAFWARRRIEES